MNDTTAQSPDYLEEPKGSGQRIMNNVPKIGLVLLIIVAVGILAYVIMDRAHAQNRADSQSPMDSGKIGGSALPPVKRPDGPDVYFPPSPPVAVAAMGPMDGPTAQGGMSEEARRIRERRIAAHEAALIASPGIQQVGARSRYQQPAQNPYMPGVDGLMPPPPPMTGEEQDPNRQDEKRAFLDRGQDQGSPYLKHTRRAALSATELKAGSIIPGVMLSGVNSDLPGQIVGQVRQNVYDSASGRYLLIPAGAKLVGSYDSSISAGQERVLVAWNRVIYPDGSSLALDSMPGADQSGFAGFKEKVDNHYVRTFGNAFLLSLFSAGLQLSQPRGAVMGTYNSQQIMAAAIGQQLGQLGMQLARRNLNIQPTLEISPGFEFSIMVTKDIILPPWTGHPLAKN